jgi:glycerophosphoryl diester phosphodiesterase
MKKDLTFLKNYDYAHRGLYKEDQSIPENSMLAFNHALNKGYAIELDVNLLKDGQVVVFHDAHLKRICHVDQLLSEVTYDEVKNLTLFDSKEYIPLLNDVLSLINGNAPLLIELKPKGDVVKLVQNVMKIMQNYHGKYALFSFHPKAIHYLKKHHPTVIRGIISEYFKGEKHIHQVKRYLLKSMFFNRFIKPDFISYGISDLPNKYLDRAYKKGMVVISYAAKSQAELDFVKQHYDNAVFEFFEPQKKR